MGSPFQGILTSEGSANILGASGSGGTVNVTSFAVSAVAGDLDPSRTTTNSTWYAGTFYPAATIVDNKVDVTLVIPPTSIQVPLTDGTPISEIYLFANVDGGSQFLLGIIHPPDNVPIIYSNIVEYDIILELQFSESNLTGIFTFVYNSGDVDAHNIDVNAHQKRWVLKAGDSMSGTLHEPNPVTKSSSNGVLSLNELGNSFIATGTETITSITGWNSGIAKIRWNTSRTLTNSSNLILITGTNRITQIGDVGTYEFTSSGCREISYTPKLGYIKREGDSVVGDITLNNATVLKSKDTNGTSNNVCFVDSENIEQIGSVNLPLNFNSSVDPKVMIGNSPQTMYHTGNLKVSNLPSYCVNSGNVDTYGVGSLLYIRNPLDSTTVSFKVGTTEYYSDYNYGYITRAGAGASSITYSNNIYNLNGTNQYLTVPKISTLGVSTWSIQRRIKFNNINTNEGILGTSLQYGVSLQRQASSNKLALKLSSNGSSFDLADATTTSKGLGSNAFNSTAYYYIKVYFNGTAYKVDYSLDGVTWINDIQVNNSIPVYSNIIKLQLGLAESYYLNGSDDMSGAKFIISGNTVFEGNLVYAAPNITVTFPNNSSYVISSIADITGLTNDGPYKIILEENNLIKLENGTYHAIPTAVKIGYSYSGPIPAIYSAVSPGGYTTSYLGHKGGQDSYEVFDQDGTGTGTWWNYSYGGSVNPYNMDYFTLDGTTRYGYSAFKLNCPSTVTLSGLVYNNPPITYYTLGGSVWTYYSSGMLVFTSSDGGNTWSAPTSISLTSGVNNLDFSGTGNAFVFAFANYGFGVDDWDSAGRWVSAGKVNDLYAIQTISYSGGNVLEDYYLSSSTSTINYTPTVQSPIMTSTNSGGFNTSIINYYGASIINNNPYQLFDGSNSTSITFAGGDQGSSYFLLISKADATPFIMTSMYLYSTAGGGAYNYGGTDGGILYGSNNTTNGNDGTWVTIKNMNLGAGGITYDLSNLTQYKTYKFSPSVSLFGGYSSGSTHYEEIKFWYTTAYASNSSNLGDYFLNLSVKPYKPLKNYTSGWAENQFIKLGEISKVSGVLGTPITYAYNGEYDSGLFNISTGVYSKNDNIGVSWLLKTYEGYVLSSGNQAPTSVNNTWSDSGTAKGSIAVTTADNNSFTFSAPTLVTTQYFIPTQAKIKVKRSF